MTREEWERMLKNEVGSKDVDETMKDRGWGGGGGSGVAPLQS